MESKGFGALPSQMIRDMIAGEFIGGASAGRVQPASLDLVLGEEAYRVSSVFQPRPGEPVSSAMQFARPERHDLRYPLEVGVTYLVKLCETLMLPEGVYGYANPKSTTGRIDLHVRMIADGIMRYDSAGSPGYRGSIWVLVTPRSFRVLLSPGNSLIQMRFFNRNTRFASVSELHVAHQLHQLVYGSTGEPVPYESLLRDAAAVMLTIDLESDLVGYRCEGSHEVLDFSRAGEYQVEDFFRPIARPRRPEEGITLRRGDFYILATSQYLRVPPQFACEMMPVDIRAGDFRAQYAGYFDPGFGWGPDGSRRGTPAVLEVRSFEDDLQLRPGQAICSMVFERMAAEPDVIYGGAGSSYQDQTGPRLSKHFRIVGR